MTLTFYPRRARVIELKKKWTDGLTEATTALHSSKSRMRKNRRLNYLRSCRQRRYHLCCKESTERRTVLKQQIKTILRVIVIQCDWLIDWLTDHSLRSCFSWVFTANGLVYGNPPFSTPDRIDVLNRSPKKFIRGDYVHDFYSCAKFGGNPSMGRLLRK